MNTRGQTGHWYRSYEEMGDDPKFRVIAKRAAVHVPGVRASDALAVWTQLLCRASSSLDRGSIDGFDCETADDSLGMPDGSACALMQAFEDKGMIHEGRIIKWEDRQPKREDGSAERSKKWRDEQKQTQPNATERNRTLEQSRADKSREDSLSPLTPDVLPPAHGQTAPPPETERATSDFEIPEPDAMPIEFQELLSAYPERRRDTVPAFKVFQAIRRTKGFMVQALFSDLATRCGCEEWTKDGGRWIPKFSRYLNEQMWRDPLARASPGEDYAWKGRVEELSRKQEEKERAQGLRA